MLPQHLQLAHPLQPLQPVRPLRLVRCLQPPLRPRARGPLWSQWISVDGYYGDESLCQAVIAQIGPAPSYFGEQRARSVLIEARPEANPPATGIARWSGWPRNPPRSDRMKMLVASTGNVAALPAQRPERRRHSGESGAEKRPRRTESRHCQERAATSSSNRCKVRREREGRGSTPCQTDQVTFGSQYSPIVAYHQAILPSKLMIC